MTVRSSYRIDRGTIQRYDDDPSGFLRAEVTLARPGVFPYLTVDGKIRQEAKIPDELFSQATVDSAQGAPVTDQHPDEGKVTSRNHSRLVKGALSSVRPEARADGRYLVGIDTIYDEVLKASVLAGEKREVSIGFDVKIDETPGEFEGQRYDAVQRQIRINHLAHVPKGRAGESVRIHLDADTDFAVMTDRESDAGGNTLKTKTFRTDDGKDIQVPEEMHPILMEQQKARKDAEEKLAALEKKVEELAAEKPEPAPAAGDGSATPAPKPVVAEASAESIADLKAKNDALEAALKKIEGQVQDSARLDALVSERLSLVEFARDSLVDFRADGLSNRAIKLAVIERELPFPAGSKTDDPKVVTDAMVDARYDAAKLVIQARNRSVNPYEGDSTRMDAVAIQKAKQGRLSLHLPEDK